MEEEARWSQTREKIRNVVCVTTADAPRVMIAEQQIYAAHTNAGALPEGLIRKCFIPEDRTQQRASSLFFIYFLLFVLSVSFFIPLRVH